MAVENTILINNQPLFYRISGNGKPVVVLVHGFAEDGTVWENQEAFLKDKCTLIIPDLPGSGRSIDNRQETPDSHREGNEEWSMEYFADCLAHVLDKENIQQVIMIGHSMGGYITLAFAEKYPNRLQAFGLFHSTAYADSEEKKNARRKGIEFMNRNGAGPFLQQSIPNLFCEETKKQRPELVKELITRYAGFAVQSLVRYYEAMIVRADRTHVLQQFPRPVLFILGKEDTAVPLEQGLQQCYMPGISYIHILGHSAHMGMMEEVPRANAYLEAFLSAR